MCLSDDLSHQERAASGFAVSIMTVDEQRVAVIVAHIVGQAHRHTLKMMKSGKFDLCLQFFKLLQLVHDLSEVMNSAIYAEKFNI